MTSILFVCRANRYRSPIAAAAFQEELVKRRPEQNWSVLSAGTWTTDGLPPMSDAILEAKQLGLDIRGHQSRIVTADMLREADLVLVMEQGQKEALQVEFPADRKKIALLTEVAAGNSQDIIDPVSNPHSAKVGPEISRLIREGFEKICAWALENTKQS